MALPLRSRNLLPHFVQHCGHIFRRGLDRLDRRLQNVALNLAQRAAAHGAAEGLGVQEVAGRAALGTVAAGLLKRSITVQLACSQAAHLVSAAGFLLCRSPLQRHLLLNLLNCGPAAGRADAMPCRL